MPNRRRTPRAVESQVPITLAQEGIGKVILVAEQRTTLRHAVRDALERRGYTVLEAADGVQALHLAMSLDSPPDLMVADRDLESLPARELVNSLSAARKLPKVLVMSADAIRHTPASVAKHVNEVLQDSPPPAA